MAEKPTTKKKVSTEAKPRVRKSSTPAAPVATKTTARKSVKRATALPKAKPAARKTAKTRTRTTSPKATGAKRQGQLVVVESPAKAKTLGRILGSGYNLMASMGHVRDLPQSQLGVDTENDFTPKYVVPRAKSKTVNELKEAAESSTTVYLATDPDREGEAIAWHLTQAMKLGQKPYQRVTFHEITEEAIQDAFKHPRTIDVDLVDAQQARRVLDRLVGYKISPLLWRKVRRGLSAGRVQSVAVRIIVEREREITAFVTEEYWTIEAELTKQEAAKSPSFRAAFVGLADGGKLTLSNEKEASELVAVLEKSGYKVSKVTKKKVTRQPPPPFITSTMQQEAWRKLRYSAKQTMVIAQQLYEGLPLGEEGSVGLITYMRTDSPRVSHGAVTETRDFITERYGAEYLPPHARAFAATAKGAQEAHEAIRPTKIHREPKAVKQYLSATQFRLYELIWQRMVASQMAAAVFDSTSVEIEAKHPRASARYLFRTTSSIIDFPGFMTLYSAGRDEDEEEEKKGSLPPLTKGEGLNLLGLFPEQRFTQPPARYTEASLIKVLEQRGIGRPSTYAPIISTIQDREYVIKEKGYLKPTELGFVVNDILVQYFPNVVDIDFTARMEDELDDVAAKKREWVKVVRDFYDPFAASLESAASLMERVKLADEVTSETCPKCGKPMVVKTGRFGKFLACSGYPECKTTKAYQIKTGAKCPECKEKGEAGELVQRMSKKRRTFYGCNRYPDCTFATSFKPRPEPCPKCGGLLLTQAKGKSAKCLKCEHRVKLEEQDAAVSDGTPAGEH